VGAEGFILWGQRDLFCGGRGNYIVGAEGFILWGQRDLYCGGRGIYIVGAEGFIFSYFHFNTFMIIIFMVCFLNNMMLKYAFWVYMVISKWEC